VGVGRELNDYTATAAQRNGLPQALSASEPGERHLDEAAATTFGIDFLETLLFLSLLDNADRSDEETQNDCHKSVNGRKRIFQRIVRERRYGRDAEIRRNGGVEALRKRCVLAEASPLLKVGRAKVAAAVELVLEGDPVRGGQRGPLLLELAALPQGEEPDHAADDGDEDRVDDEEPVEDDEADCDMVPLHDRSQRH